MMRRWIWAVIPLALLWSGQLVQAKTYTGGEDLSAVWQRYLLEEANATPAIRFPYSDCFNRAALTNNLPKTLLIALARGESDFDPNARSHANAHGLMQILWPATARELGFTALSELYEPCANVDAGARYLRGLLDRYDGDLHLALAAYNYGPSRIHADTPLPDGAQWYSGYIYRHMRYVLSKSSPDAAGDVSRSYVEEGKIDLIVFNEPYRAAAFVRALERDAGGVRFDWFRIGQASYRVVMLFDDAGEYQRGKTRLRKAGFSLD